MAGRIRCIHRERVPFEAVRNYILHQEEHHQTVTFQEEYVAMLKRGLVEYDEKYLW